MPPVTPARMKKGMRGSPGTRPSATRMPDEMANALGWAMSWPPISCARLLLSSSEATRVVTMPAVTEMSSAGIWDTRPSPMVSRV